MKQQIARTLIAFTLAIAGLAATAAAQSTSAMTVNIPFEFTLGERNYPAGEYSFVREQHILVLRDAQRRSLAQVLAQGVESPIPLTEVKLKFSTYEGQHTLTEVWNGQDSLGALLFRSKSQANEARRRSAELRETDGGGQQ